MSEYFYKVLKIYLIIFFLFLFLCFCLLFIDKPEPEIVFAAYRNQFQIFFGAAYWGQTNKHRYGICSIFSILWLCRLTVSFFPFLWYISINKAKVIPIRFLVSLSNNAYFKHVSFVYGQSYHTHRGERER